MVRTGACLRVLASVTSISAVDAHGRLTYPMTRVGHTGYENDPVPSNTDERFVCRHAQPNPSVARPTIVAGSATQIQYDLTAAHVGDCALYISYDAHLPLLEQRYVKIANFPDCKGQNGRRVSVDVPSALPAGDAILRWDWYALHNFAGVEWYDQCADVHISSASARTWDSFNRFLITNPPIYPATGNEKPGFHNPYGGGSFYMTGPACVDGSINQCHLTAPGTQGFTGFGGENANDSQPTPAPPAPAAPSSPPTAAPAPTAPGPFVPTAALAPTQQPAVPQPTAQPAPMPTMALPTQQPTPAPTTSQPQPTAAPVGICVGTLPDGKQGECTGCLASDNVCFTTDKSYCDSWPDSHWCGEEPTTTSEEPVGICGECTGCLGSNNVCYATDKSYCDSWPDSHWCGEELASLAQGSASRLRGNRQPQHETRFRWGP